MRINPSSASHKSSFRIVDDDVPEFRFGSACTIIGNSEYYRVYTCICLGMVDFISDTSEIVFGK